MGDFEAPSFSLGFDFDTSEPQITPNNTSNRVLEAVLLASDVKTLVDGNDNDEEFEIETLTVVDSDDGDEVVRPRLKRLRRGGSLGTVDLGSGNGKSTVEFCSGSGLGSVVVDDDDIEDFSSPEDNNAKGKSIESVYLIIAGFDIVF